MSLQELVDTHVLGGGQRCFLVRKRGDTIGLMTLARIMEIPRTAWPSTHADQAMLPLDEMRSIAPDTELWTAIQSMDRNASINFQSYGIIGSTAC